MFAVAMCAVLRLVPWAGEFLVITGEGDVYSAQEVKDWLDETGWRVVDRRPLAGPMSLIVAEAVG